MDKKDEPKIRTPFDKATHPSAQPKFSIDPISSGTRGAAGSSCAECHAGEGELQRIDHLSALEGAKVSVSPDNRLHVEFKINELIKKLVPGGALSSSCGGCGGCMGCGH